MPEVYIHVRYSPFCVRRWNWWVRMYWKFTRGGQSKKPSLISSMHRKNQHLLVNNSFNISIHVTTISSMHHWLCLIAERSWINIELSPMIWHHCWIVASILMRILWTFSGSCGCRFRRRCCIGIIERKDFYVLWDVCKDVRICGQIICKAIVHSPTKNRKLRISKHADCRTYGNTQRRPFEWIKLIWQIWSNSVILPVGKMRKRFFRDSTFDPISFPSSSICSSWTDCDMLSKVINIQITAVVVVVGVMLKLTKREKGNEISLSCYADVDASSHMISLVANLNWNWSKLKIAVDWML